MGKATCHTITIGHQRHPPCPKIPQLLFDEGTPWEKRETSHCFDVTMGSYDGAETCELVGLYVLAHFREKFPNGNIGLYRDDGLAAFETKSGREADILRKKFIETFKSFGLKITVASNRRS